MRRRPARRAGCPTVWRRSGAADAPASNAAAPRPHSRCRPARTPEWTRSFAGHFGFAHVGYAEARDDVIAEIGGIADGVERLDTHLLADDFDPHLIVRRRAGDHGRLDA